MARSINYWYDVIIGEKNTMSNLTALQPNIDDAQTLLSDLTTTSRVARWRLWVWCVAACIYALDVLFDLFKIELDEIASRSRYGNLRWYAYIAKEYQHGHSLVWLNSQFKYAVVDDAAKIIKRSAAVKNSTVVNLKVATLVGTTVTPLNPVQLAAFTTYIDEIAHPGVVVHIISSPPDELRLFIKVVYDALVLTSTGESILNSGVFPAENAINDYRNSLDFNGTFELCDCVDKIQAANGVVAAYVTTASARYGANPFITFPERYVPNAGHLIIDSGTPLNTSITYQSNV